jgi:hypothetical protein
MAKTKNNSAGREKMRAGGRYPSVTAEAGADHPDQLERSIDQLLDEALEQTFPASDAVAVVFARSR